MWEREFFDQTEGRFELCEDEAMLANGVLTMVLKRFGMSWLSQIECDWDQGPLGPCHDHSMPVFQNSWGHHVGQCPQRVR